MKTNYFRSIVTALVVAFAVFFVFPVSSQIIEPVKWSSQVKKVEGDVAEISIKATIQEGWNLYAQDLPPGGPLPTVLTFVKSSDFKTIGKTSAWPKATESYDETFEMTIGKWKKSATFTQKIQVIGKKKFNIDIDIDYMVCDENSCIPFTENMKVQIDGSQYEAIISDTEPDTVVQDTVSSDTIVQSENPVLTDAGEGEDVKTEKSIWLIFLIGLGGGFLALLTPCVWPIIPMTVSFFLNKTQTKRGAIKDAFFYGISIIVVYVILGLSISLIFGPAALGGLATSPIFNIFFFALLVVFAIAFFGAFELTLPSKWVNAMDRKTESNKGLLGTFFMGLTLVLVSFSCTGPILGALLVEAASSSNFLAPLMGMLGFSTAMAIPFTLLAIFPSLLKSMPKSGGWMNSVKVVLAFFMLAFSLKFFVVADSIAGWNIMSRELFLAIWIVISILMGMYLLGKIKMYHDSEVKHIGIGRLFLAGTSFVIAILLLPGLWGAPLKAISGFTPSITTQSFNLTKMSASSSVDMSQFKDYKIKEGNYGLIHFLDYEQGMKYAAENKKPVFLDFSGIGCTNCKKMESSVWGEPEVLPYLQNEFVIITLYTDDREELPEDQQFISTTGGKERKIKTVGQKWADMQAAQYGVNAQPYYILLDNEGNKLAEPHAFDSDVESFASFLKEGIEAYKKK